MAENWAKQTERGTRLGVLVSAWLYKLLGRRITLIILSPVVLFFYLNGRTHRRSSMAYLKRAQAMGFISGKPGFVMQYRHFMAFTGSLLDKLAAWSGHIKPEHVAGVHDGLFDAAKKHGRGALVLTAHMGNPELIRAIATVNQRFGVTVLVHTANAEKFNSVINQFSSQSTVRLVQVSEITVATAMRLSEDIERGEWVVMTADRVPPEQKQSGASVPVTFMGDTARFPIGPYVLAAALKCPSYFLACARLPKRRGKVRFNVTFEAFMDPVVLPRKDRQEALAGLAGQFAACLERALRATPLQWFNFFDFWEDDNQDSPSDQSETMP